MRYFFYLERGQDLIISFGVGGKRRQRGEEGERYTTRGKISPNDSLKAKLRSSLGKWGENLGYTHG